jgi:hypothetical protein
LGIPEKAAKHLVWMETTQIAKLRAIFDSIKDLIFNINLKFFPESHEAHGMLVMAMDALHVAWCAWLPRSENRAHSTAGAP